MNILHRSNTHRISLVKQCFCLLGLLTLPLPSIAIDVGLGVTLAVRPLSKQLSDGTNLNNVNFWVYCDITVPNNPTCLNNPPVPGPSLELGASTPTFTNTANINFVVNDTGSPSTGEPANYSGHAIYFHGLDLPENPDRLPNFFPPTTGDTYTFSVSDQYVGSHMYYSRVHTVKHQEMGMYGALIVRAVDAQNQFTNLINTKSNIIYNQEWVWVLSTVDPTYHDINSVGDNVVFAKYNPIYFLVNGNQGPDNTTPSEVFEVLFAPNQIEEILVIRLKGLHNVGATFQILDTGGNTQEFDLHNMDGFALNSPKLKVKQVEISPGQTKDILITLPKTIAPTELYPEVTYRRLIDDSPYATVHAVLRLQI